MQPRTYRVYYDRNPDSGNFVTISQVVSVRMQDGAAIFRHADGLETIVGFGFAYITAEMETAWNPTPSMN